MDFDKVLMATGRGPNTKNLGLEEAGVETDDAGYGLTAACVLKFAENMHVCCDQLLDYFCGAIICLMVQCSLDGCSPR
jgi:hypothetical protein